MHRSLPQGLEEIYSACRSLLGQDLWDRLVSSYSPQEDPEEFIGTIEARKGELSLPDFLPELARLEWSVARAESVGAGYSADREGLTVNPTLQLLQLPWKNLGSLVNPRDCHAAVAPERGEELLLMWRDPETLQVSIETPTDDLLLALKIVLEDLDRREVAQAGNVPVAAIDAVIAHAVRKGILAAPPSMIRRGDAFPTGQVKETKFFSAEVFTLQWHITQTCDLHCKHCYDRGERSPFTLDAGYKILDDLCSFCVTKGVKGQVSFSGGNPLLNPDFAELYRAASERGFALAVLGNPTPRERIEELLKIEKPVFFQVSLEGLEEHNDTMRGRGHFTRTTEFLKTLRDLDIYSMVMLTLTRDNINQVIPLAEILRDKVDLFTFNRLSLVGEGAGLLLPAPGEYAVFLEKYLDAAEENPIMALKDNLINIVRYKRGLPLFGGCAGFGCSAAFNFLALLPDGEVHACRKFPSRIGSVHEKTIAEIYDSEQAERYRQGSKSCESCAIRPVCGGCLASTHSHGLDIFVERDPYCFMDMPGKS